MSSKLYIIPGDYMYSLMQEILYTIDDEYEDDRHFWRDELKKLLKRISYLVENPIKYKL